MVIKIVANLACSFIGTIAYAVMFQVPRRFYIGCGITGSVGWMIYKLASVYCSVAVASFIGTVCTVLVARMLTVRLKCPITIFLISGIITLVPGAGILSGDQSACYGSGKRIGSGKSGFCNRAWNCVYRVYSERSFPERILDREKTQKTAKRKDMIEKVAVSYRLVLQ